MLASKYMKTLLVAIGVLFLLLLAGLIGLLSVKTKNHLITYDVSINQYTEQNKILKDSNMKQPDAVFIGNSITENWYISRPNFFTDNNYINRGIGGQTTPQLLLRFQSDVVDLNPKLVVIGGGVNDIAENTGLYNPDFTFNNLKSMADIASQNGIKVIIASLTPTTTIEWNTAVKDVPEKIANMNTKLKAYAEQKGYGYVDYYSAVIAEDKGIKPEYRFDLVHLNIEGYKVIEPIIKQKIKEMLAED